MTIMLDSLRRAAAQSFLNDIYTKQSRLYFFFGQITNFDSTSLDESTSLDYINQTKNNIVAIKEILPSDACFVIDRKDFEVGVEYKKWTTSGGEWDYVYNPSNYSIYICVNSEGNLSSNEPTHQTINPVKYADGYTWRYVYTVPLALRDKFLTAEYIPVSNSLTESYFSNGGIDSISILGAGEGYDKNSTSIQITGQGGVGHGALVEPVITDGKIVSVIIHNPGYGYVSPTITVISNGTNTKDALLSPNLTKGDIRSSSSVVQTLAIPGTIESIDILSGGSEYTENLTIVVDGDGTGATVEYERNATTGEVTKITVSNMGSGYTWAKLVVTDIEFGGSGLDVHINLSPIFGFGRDVVSDLNAVKVTVFQSLSRETNEGLSLENQIRQFGLISGPKNYENSTYPSSYITKNNYVTKIPLSQVTSFTVGTTIYNEYPVTASTKTYIVEEQVVGVTSAAIRVRATNGGTITSGSRYYKNDTDSFVADYTTYTLSTSRQFLTSCFILETTSPTFFDINTFTTGKILTCKNKKYAITAVSSEKILVASIEGGTLVLGDILYDEDSNPLEFQSLSNPSFDKRTGSLLTIERVEEPLTYSKVQSISFRTTLDF